MSSEESVSRPPASPSEWALRSTPLVLVALLSTSVHLEALRIPPLLTEAWNLQHHLIIGSLNQFFERMLTVNGIVEKPISFFVLAVVHHLFGESSAAFHAINILFHFINCVVFFYLAKSFGKIPLVASFLFALHPLVTGATSRIFGLPSLLGCTFMLLALVVLRSSTAAKLPFFRAALTIGLFGLMLLTKPSFVFFPLLMPLFILKKGNDKRDFLKNRTNMVIFGTILLAATWYAIRYLKWTAAADGQIGTVAFIISQFSALPDLVGLFAWPTHLAVYHGPQFIVMPTVRSAVIAAAASISAGVAWRCRRTAAAPFLLAFVIALAPCAVASKNELIYEWRLYPALPFFILFVVHLPLRREFLCCLVPVFAVLTFLQYRTYSNEEAAYRSALRDAPFDYTLNYHLARILVAGAHYAEARSPLDVALSAQPDNKALLEWRELVAHKLGETDVLKKFADRMFSVDYPIAPRPFDAFTQVHSSIGELQGKALITANWEGRFSPYLINREAVQPLLPASERLRFHRTDFYSPVGLPDGSVLMSGQQEGRREFDLYLFDHVGAKVVNLTNTPKYDEGSFCLSPDSERISYTSTKSFVGNQKFATLSGSLMPLAVSEQAPAFSHCIFLSRDLIFGILGEEGMYSAYVCSISDSVHCRKLPNAVSSLKRLVALEPYDEIHVKIVGVTDEWSAAHVLNVRTSTLETIGEKNLKADLLQDDDADCRRTGAGSHYALAAHADPGVTVVSCRKINGVLYGVVGSVLRHKTLARVENGKWVYLPPPFSSEVSNAVEPHEVLTQHDGKLTGQGWLYSKPGFRDLVVMFHGGPHESQSPRFNPYVAALNEKGIAVLAFNYPGSTTFGHSYEDGFSKSTLDESLHALWQQIDTMGFERKFTWSVSSGIYVQKALLHVGLPVDGIIDQAGGYHPDIAASIRSRRIPFFGIRGVFDMHYTQRLFNFVYRGGHDITWEAHFRELMEKITAFVLKPQ